MNAAAGPASVRQLDPRFAAFIAGDGPEVFSAVVYANQIWNPDPFDVETIHQEARDTFARLLNRAAGPELPPYGKALLLLGEAGSGKTHLMRAFRLMAHAAGTGYCGYLQMTTRTDNYARYVLSKLIDALEQPYQPSSGATGLTRLARGLFDSLQGVPEVDRRRFLQEPHDPADLVPLVERFADEVIANPRFADSDLDVVRAFLYLLPGDGRIRTRVLKWLRCEDLSPYDRAMLGGLVPRSQDEKPLRTIVGLGRLIAAVHQAALVLCVDQLEEMIQQSEAEEKRGELFRRAIDVLLAVTEEIPTAVVVVACLEDYYASVGKWLTKPKHDRLTRDPEPIRLSSHRSVDEITSMIAKRLEVLYADAGASIDAANPVFPFTTAHMQKLSGVRTRDVLDFVRQHHEECVRAHRWINPKFPESATDGKEIVSPSLQPFPLEQRWNDFLAAYQAQPLEEEGELADLLAGSIQSVSAEMSEGFHFATESDGRMVPVEAHGPGDEVEKLLVAVCEKDPRGSGLRKEVEEAAKRAGENVTILVRSTPFPASPHAVVSKLIANLIAPVGKGRRVVVQNADWRALAAFRDFQAKEKADPEFGAWQRQGRPLSSLPALRAILDLDKRLTRRAVPPPSPADAKALPLAGVPKPIIPPTPRPVVTDTAHLLLGTTRGMNPSPVTLAPQELTYHAAFLGGSGSGKTTTALNLIEQLLLRGVPAVLIDRKGDLCRYADPAAWAEPADAAPAERRRALRDRLDVGLFTPGSAAGRPLALPIAPAGLEQLPEAEREQLAGFAASALAAMMGYKPRGPDPKLAILSKAIEVLAVQPGRDVTIDGLRRLVEERDEALLLAVDGFDARHYKKLGEDLHSLGLQRRQLLASAAEPLDIDNLLGRGLDARPGKIRLSIISTQFLGDPAAVEFWVAQLLLALDRWRSKNPCQQLQAVLLFDEADAYLPTNRQPATKAPMESLLRRARSAGIGLFLATQSPGDLDYKCRDQIRTWLIGRVKEQVAISKLKPMLEAGRVDAVAKLPGQGTGQFYLVREREVVPLQSEPSLIPTAQLPEDRILDLARASQ
jgi:hypothetical protein